MKKKILVIDIGGTNVKLMISREKNGNFDSGPKLTPKQTGLAIEEDGGRLETTTPFPSGFPSAVRDGQNTERSEASRQRLGRLEF